MIDRVHDHAAHMRPAPLPASASRLAARYIHVIDISHLAYRGKAVFANPSNFARRQFHECVTGLDVRQRRLLTRAARDLATAARSQFNVVNIRAKGNRAERQRISYLRRSIVAGGDGCSDSKAIWRENVTQLAIRIFDEGNARGAVRVVLDPDHLCWDTALAPFEINFAIFLLMTAANMP